MRIVNNAVLITGGASGIGLAFAESLAALGNRVLISVGATRQSWMRRRDGLHAW